MRMSEEAMEHDEERVGEVMEQEHVPEDAAAEDVPEDAAAEDVPEDAATQAEAIGEDEAVEVSCSHIIVLGPMKTGTNVLVQCLSANVENAIIGQQVWPASTHACISNAPRSPCCRCYSPARKVLALAFCVSSGFYLRKRLGHVNSSVDKRKSNKTGRCSSGSKTVWKHMAGPVRGLPASCGVVLTVREPISWLASLSKTRYGRARL